jgi:hypothetical protein
LSIAFFKNFLPPENKRLLLEYRQWLDAGLSAERLCGHVKGRASRGRPQETYWRRSANA